MNWNRAGLKNMAKTALAGNYWTAVLIAFLLMLPGGFRVTASVRDGWELYSYGDFLRITTGVFGGGTVLNLLRIFLFNPLGVGCRRFFVEDLYAPVGPDYIKAGFTPNYLNVVLVTFVRDIIVFLWTLLFIVPGIIKAYEYRMVDFLLADYPDMPYREALDRSRQMMDGEKMNAFVLDLSFIGWHIGAVCTLGLLGIFYVQPYQALTNAALYAALTDKMQKIYGDGSR